MDDKNKEIIDFSNQPLGLMAQEGAKIEDNLNSEYRMNEAKRNNAGTQDNPFADVTFGKKEVAPVIDNKPILSNEVQNMPTTPVEQPTPVVPEPIKQSNTKSFGLLWISTKCSIIFKGFSVGCFVTP